MVKEHNSAEVFACTKQFLSLNAKKVCVKNPITRELAKQADIIKNLKSKMYDKEDKLYLKFGNLESQMNKLNSQMNYFMQG